MDAIVIKMHCLDVAIRSRGARSILIRRIFWTKTGKLSHSDFDLTPQVTIMVNQFSKHHQ